MVPDVDSGAARRLHVGSDGIVVLAEPGLAQQIVHHDDEDCGDQHQIGQAIELAVAELRQPGILHRHCRAAGEQEGSTTCNAEHAERANEGRDLEPRDQ